MADKQYTSQYKGSEIDDKISQIAGIKNAVKKNENYIQALQDNKVNHEEVPTRTSQLQNDSDFICFKDIEQMLSSNDFTDAEKIKLAGIAEGAEVNIQHDWNQTDSNQDDFIKNKIPIANGSGKNSVVIIDGEANADYSIAGGTTDKTLVESIVGIASLLIDINKAKANGIMSMAFGVDTEAKTAGSVALGIANVAGVQGYYWHTIDFTNKTITLTTDRPTTLSNSVKAPTSLDWTVGDYISIMNGSKYPFCTKITAISGNTITVEELPFTTNNYDTTTSILGKETIIYPATYTVPHDRSIYAVYQDEYISVLGKTVYRWMSRGGTVDFGLGGFAIGVLNRATGLFATAKGRGNLAIGDYSDVSGEDNIAGTWATARGKGTKALGTLSTTEGNGTIAYGNSQHVQGRFNIEDTENKYADIVGNGTSNENRSNAYTLDWNGNATFAGDIWTQNGNAKVFTDKNIVEMGTKFLEDNEIKELAKDIILGNIVGTFAVNPLIDGVTGAFSVKLDFPIIYDTYEVLVNGKSLNGDVNKDETLVSAPLVFKGDDVKILFKKGDETLLTAKTSCVNEVGNIIYGRVEIVNE